MSDPSIYVLAVVLVLTAIAAAWDLRTGEIPNRLVAIGAIASLAAVIVGSAADDFSSLLHALLGMVMGMALVSMVPMILFRSGGIGGGDVKLLAVLGAALGPYAGIEAELYAFVFAMLYAPARLIWEGKLMHAIKTTGALAVRPLIPKHRRPAPIALEEQTALRFAPAIFLGTLMAAVPHLGSVR